MAREFDSHLRPLEFLRFRGFLARLLSSCASSITNAKHLRLVGFFFFRYRQVSDATFEPMMMTMREFRGIYHTTPSSFLCAAAIMTMSHLFFVFEDALTKITGSRIHTLYANASNRVGLYQDGQGDVGFLQLRLRVPGKLSHIIRPLMGKRSA